jgi:hypothetical protein
MAENLMRVQFEPLRQGDDAVDRIAAIKHALYVMYQSGHLFTDTPAHLGILGTRLPDPEP